MCSDAILQQSINPPFREASPHKITQDQDSTNTVISTLTVCGTAYRVELPTGH